ncbi:hypothetical protein ASE36_00045 [Rhizobium sp. Root274]|uniref:hypothetical protein n=1 Tax=unclassified Rhizobium TaxID=2613769 RepID=UPI000713A944|nr:MULTISPECIES: hypothetical protein [unclassified Rhizobium]KQW30730.1 hypothetical protein ASC71_00045 [Rhizobium sp. Root1240]KRD32277.1 hypothetical protein ASE36_00045 [Rhizobium sp. Root274]
MTETLLAAMYETKRQNFLIGFVNNPERFDPALAFAYYHRMAPIFHEDDLRETEGGDPFESIYSVKRQFVVDVTNHIDENWLNRTTDNVQFNKLEDRFGGYKANRMEILVVLEYSRIAGRFDDELFDAVVKGAPIEASKIDATFRPEDIYFD